MENFKRDLEAIKKGNAIYDKYITKTWCEQMLLNT